MLKESEWTDAETSIKEAVEAKRELSMSECAHVEHVMQVAAGSAKTLDRAYHLAKRVVQVIPPDHRVLNAHDYVGVVLQRVKDNHGAYLAFHTASRNEPAPIDRKLNPAAVLPTFITPSPSPPPPPPAPPLCASKDRANEIGNTECTWWVAPSEEGVPIRHAPCCSNLVTTTTTTTVTTTESANITIPARIASRRTSTAANAAPAPAPATTPTTSVLSPLVPSTPFVGITQSRMMMHLRENMLIALAGVPLRTCVPHDPCIVPLSSIVDATCRAQIQSLTVRHPFHVSTPSVVTDANGNHWIAIRTTNYTLTDAHRYVFAAGDASLNIVESRIHVARLPTPSSWKDGDLLQLFTRELQTPRPTQPHESVAKGWEDPRLVLEPRSQRMFAVCTVWSSAGNKPGGHMGVLELESTPTELVRGAVVLCHDAGTEEDRHSQIPVISRLPDATQKNWAAFTWRGQLYFVYSFHPLTILKADLPTGLCRLVAVDANLKLNDWRGSSALVRIPLPWVRRLPGMTTPPTVLQDLAEDQVWFLTVVHVMRWAKHDRADLPRAGHDVPWIHHQFVVLKLQAAHASAQFRPLSLSVRYYSTPFRFGPTHGVEYCCGLAPASPDADRWIVSYSLRDEESHILSFDGLSLWRRLESVPEPPLLRDYFQSI